MKRALLLGALLAGAALAGGREPGPVMPLPGMASHAAGHADMGHSAHLMQMHMAEMLAPLRPLSGRAFDVKWTELMIDHHQMALDMAQHELMHGTDARVKAAARKVIDAQQKEITTMQGWLKAWTGKTHQPQAMPMGMDNVGSMDRWFLEGMIPHHQGAIDMARLVPARTQNVQLRQMAQDIIRVQSAELTQYRQWLGALK